MRQKRVIEQRRELTDIRAEMEEINNRAADEGRDLTDEEQSDYEVLEQNAGRVRRSLDRFEAMADLPQSAAEERSEMAVVPVITPSAKDDAEEQQRAMLAYIRSGRPNAGMEKRAANDSDMLVGTDNVGGYAVPTGHYQQIISRREELMLARQLGVMNIPGKGTTVNVPLDAVDDNLFTATDEAADSTRNSPLLGVKAMTLVKYTTRIPITHELMHDEDSQLLAFISDWIGRGMAKTHNALLIAEVDASGTSYHTFAANNAIAAGEIEAIEGADEVGGYLEDANVAWVMRNSVLGTIRAVTGDRFYGTEETGGPGVGTRRSLLGYGVHRTIAAPAIATTAKSVYFGNWGYVGLREVPEFELLVDPYSEATAGKTVLHYYFRAVYGVLQPEAVGYGEHPV